MLVLSTTKRIFLNLTMKFSLLIWNENIINKSFLCYKNWEEEDLENEVKLITVARKRKLCSTNDSWWKGDSHRWFVIVERGAFGSAFYSFLLDILAVGCWRSCGTMNAVPGRVSEKLFASCIYQQMSSQSFKVDWLLCQVLSTHARKTKAITSLSTTTIWGLLLK